VNRIRSLAFRLVFVALGAGAVLAAACGDNGNSFDEPTPAGDSGARKDGSGIADVGTPPADDSGGNPKPDVADVFVWPDCNTQPSAAASKTIPQVWQDDPVNPTEVWLSDVYVVAISGGACSAGKACQIFLQADPSYGTLTAAAKHGVRMFISAAASTHLVGVKVGDKVNALGFAWRYTIGGQHELLVEVNAALPGCTKTTASNQTLTPIPNVQLSDLTLDVYENTHGPLFVNVPNVSGKPDPTPTTTFGLFPTPDGGGDAGLADGGANIVSLSPFFIPGGAFTGLSSSLTHFKSITAVFGIFTPDDAGSRYLELYPPSMADVQL
jgi:hypothetical protein